MSSCLNMNISGTVVITTGLGESTEETMQNKLQYMSMYRLFQSCGLAFYVTVHSVLHGMLVFIITKKYSSTYRIRDEGVLLFWDRIFFLIPKVPYRSTYLYSERRLWSRTCFLILSFIPAHILTLLINIPLLQKMHFPSI